MKMPSCPRSTVTFFDDVGDVEAIGGDELFEDVNDLVEPAAVGAGGLAGQEGVGHEGRQKPEVEESVPAPKRPSRWAMGSGRAKPRWDEARVAFGGRVTFGDGHVTHARSPFIWWVGVASRAAFSARRAISRRWTPRGSLPICSRRTRTAWMRASGRGGQPGR